MSASLVQLPFLTYLRPRKLFLTSLQCKGNLRESTYTNCIVKYTHFVKVASHSYRVSCRFIVYNDE